MKRRGWGWSWIAFLVLLAQGCKEPLEAPKSLSYATNPATYVAGTTIAPNAPQHAGGAVDSYTVSPSLPAGLSLDAKTGVISGLPRTITSTASYTVTAQNAAGQATVAVSLTVASPGLAITTQPANQTALVGATATFSVVASGVGTLTYQWQKDGVDIPQATAATYTTPVIAASDDGASFVVAVSDAFGDKVTSQAAQLSVTATVGTGVFLGTGSMNEPRIFHTATPLGDGSVLVAGGEDAAVASGTAERYDPAAGTFTYTSPLAVARYNHTATLLPSGKVLLVGGVNAGGTLASAELYDPTTGIFTATGSLASARSDHSATLLPDGKVLIVGGRASTITYVATAELYDPSVGTFTTTSQAPLVSRATHSATLLANGRVLIAGGFQGASLASAELFDPTTGVFTATGSLGVARSYHSATLLSSGKVLLVGGAASASTELYDPTTGLFSAGATLATARAYWHAAVLLSSGKVLIAGGVGAGSPGALLSAAEVYDPSTGAFTATGSLATPREAPSATILGDGSVLIAGGGSTATLASAERYH